MFHAKFDDVKKVWDSCNIPSIFNLNISIGHILLRSLKLYGPKIAQINDDSGERLTFEDLRLKTIRAAQNLQKRGYKLGQVFGIVAENVAHLPSIVFASLCLGCPINPFNTGVDKAYLIRAFQMTEPCIVFCDVKVCDLVTECLREMGSNARLFTFNGTKGDSEPVESLFEETGIEEDFVPVELDGVNHIAAIMGSSGTTGFCKGVNVSHAALISGCCNTTYVNPNDVIIHMNSIRWVSGLMFFLMGTINGATRIETTEDFSPKLQLRLIEEYKVTFVYNQSYYLVELLKSGLMSKADLTSVKHMLCSGCKVPLSLRAEIDSYLPNGCVNNAYGLTESAAGIAGEFPEYTGKDTVGRILNGYVIKIIDEDGNRCGIDVAGEICVKSRHKFLGYYKDKQLTDEALDSDGFFLTGDIGHFDKDGFLFISDRKKDVICSDEWVYPSQIEEILLQSPEIKGACVVGVQTDLVLEAPAAIVVRAIHSTITEDDICKMVADNMADYCKLRGGVYFVDSIPTTFTGKPLRRVAKEIANELYGVKRSDNYINNSQ